MKLGIFKNTIILSLSAIMLFSSTPISARASQEEDRVIKSYVVDKNGNSHIEYYNFDYLPIENYSIGYGRATSNLKNGAINSLMSAAAAPTYTSSLTGAVNDYTYAVAMSESTTLINYMYVSISAYMANGELVGTKSACNDPGWLAGTISASVTMPPNIFPYKFGIAHSRHIYRCDGYAEVTKTLDWKR